MSHHLRPESINRWRKQISDWTSRDPSLHFLTILDEDYPSNLRLIFNPPPFLTVRGRLSDRDARGVSVVGTRRPTAHGEMSARRLGRELAEAGITVVSGLALGIDAAAHEGALDGGGRTVAVLGHGLLRPVYPGQNRELAEGIVSHGALISQFRPDTPPTQHTFPMRNVVTSGLSQGTVVVEASKTSGARAQARFAAEHGRRVWLLASLVERFPWARTFLERYADRARVIQDVSDVLTELRSADEINRAAADGLPPVPEVEIARHPSPQPLTLFA